MKKLALGILILFVITFSNAYSQSVYVKFGGGYGLGVATQGITNHPISQDWDFEYGSFGEGINFQAGVGYNFNTNLSFEVTGSYTLGKKYESVSSTEPISNNKYYANSIFILPSAIIKAPMKDITPYIRFGMVIGIPTKYQEQTLSGTGALSGTLKYKESGGLGLGFQGGLGINIKAGKQLGFFAEIFGIGMNYSPSKRENTENYTGLALQPTITYSEAGSFGNPLSSLPSQRYSFSSFGMNVGLTYTFVK